MRISSHRLCRAAILGLGLALSVPSARATLFAYDPFNQAAGPMNGTSSSGGTPDAIWPAAGQNYFTPTGTSVIVSGSLSGSVLTQGNHAQLGPEATASIFRSFGTTFGGAGTDLWVSFLLNASTAHVSQVLSLFNGSTEELAIGVVSNNQFGMSVRTGGATTSTGNPAAATTAVADNNTHFIAVHLQLNAGTGNSTFTYFYDPSVASYGTAAPSGGLTAAYTGNGSQPFSFDRIRLGEFSTTTTSFDEVRVADSWADVSPVAAPEPGTASLLALGALGLSRRRRR